MKLVDKSTNLFSVKVGEVWQANRFEVGPDRPLDQGTLAGKLREQLRRYGLRFKVIGMRYPGGSTILDSSNGADLMPPNATHAVVENCFGPKHRRNIRLNRFNSSRKGYTRIGR